MMSPGEHISLAFAHHADEFYELLGQAFRKTSDLRSSGNRAHYIRGLLQEFNASFGAHRYGRLRVSSSVREVPRLPVFTLDGPPGEKLQEPVDLVIVVEYSDDRTTLLKRAVFYRFLLKKDREDLWYVPRRNVEFLAGFPPFRFGGGKSLSPMIRDRFSGSFWFVNPGGDDFIVSSLGLDQTTGDIIRMSELQGQFRFRAEVALVRQLLGRFGDDLLENRDLSDLVDRLYRMSEDPAATEFAESGITRENHSFYLLKIKLACAQPEKIRSGRNRTSS